MKLPPVKFLFKALLLRHNDEMKGQQTVLSHSSAYCHEYEEDLALFIHFYMDALILIIITKKSKQIQLHCIIE